MTKAGFEPRVTLATWFAIAIVLLVAAGHAEAQIVNPVPPRPGPTFNPSTPNIVPQPPPAPVSPSLPSVAPGSEAMPAQDEIVPTLGNRAHRPAETPTKATAETTTHRGHRPVRVSRAHRGTHWATHSRTAQSSVVRCPCYFPAYAQSDYFVRPYGPVCVWHREWSGRWFNDCRG